MTIAEKSTELGIDLAQIALDDNQIMTCTLSGVFDCYCGGGLKKNIDIKDDSGVVVGEWSMPFRYTTTDFIESTPLATIQADFISYINALEFTPAVIQEVLTPKE